MIGGRGRRHRSRVARGGGRIVDGCSERRGGRAGCGGVRHRLEGWDVREEAEEPQARRETDGYVCAEPPSNGAMSPREASINANPPFEAVGSGAKMQLFRAGHCRKIKRWREALI